MMEYFHKLMEECTTIELYTETLGDEENGTWVDRQYIRAGKVGQSREEYNLYLDKLTVQVQTEISLLSEEQKTRIVKRLNTILENHTKAWNIYVVHLERWYSGSFKAMSFESDFFHLFNMKTQTCFMSDSPGFPGMITTDQFFTDLLYAWTDKNGILCLLVHDLSMELDREAKLQIGRPKEYDFTSAYFSQSNDYSRQFENGIIPTPKTKDEEWDQFTRYYAQRKGESMQFDLDELHGGVIPLDVIREELKAIDSFIAEASLLRIEDAFKKGDTAYANHSHERTRYFHVTTKEDKQEEYIRLKNGYYNFLSNRKINLYLNSLAVEVYGKFILYRQWLESKLVVNPVIKKVVQFEDYLTEEGKPFLPFIKEKYKNAKPRRLVPLLYALSDCGALAVPMPATGDQENYHCVLSFLLGSIGKRQSLNTSINNYNMPTSKQRESIQSAKNELQHFIANKSLT